MPRSLSCALPISAVVLLGFALTPAHAQLRITLDNPNQIGVAGETLTFGGTVTSAGVRIDGTSYDITNQVGAAFSSDDITDVFGPAHQGESQFLRSGTTHPTLFTVTIPTIAMGGDYAMGNYFVSYTPTAAVTGVAFSVLVAPAVTPEPSALAFLTTSILSGAAFLKRRKRARKTA